MEEASETSSWSADNVLMEAWVMQRQRKHQVRREAYLNIFKEFLLRIELLHFAAKYCSIVLY